MARSTLLSTMSQTIGDIRLAVEALRWSLLLVTIALLRRQTLIVWDAINVATQSLGGDGSGPVGGGALNHAWPVQETRSFAAVVSSPRYRQQPWVSRHGDNAHEAAMCTWMCKESRAHNVPRIV
mmetsp:Transcript_114887/g.199045  ORF Transcript_114887/g.199045 Transcript_114887/m.199045 type:complete len:124 (+) Transcript_114887:471-842(+)